MYKCDLCRQPSQPGQPRTVHVVKRSDGSILREIPVCSECKRQIDQGQSATKLKLLYSKRPVQFLPQTVGEPVELT